MLDAIVFIHWGSSDYRDCALEQASKYNPETKILLISDSPYVKDGASVSNLPLDSFFHAADELRPFFTNFSSNDAEYEYKCFARWFVLRDVCLQLSINNVFYADSDVLIYDNLNRAISQIGNIEFSLSHGCCGHSSFWTIGALSNFCQHILHIYQNDKDRLIKWYEDYKAAGQAGGYNDMSALAEFSQNLAVPGYEITNIVNDFTFDHNANMSQNGNEQFLMRNGAKELFWVDGRPHGKLTDTERLIRFVSIHFQGFAKTQIPDVYRGRPQIYE